MPNVPSENFFAFLADAVTAEVKKITWICHPNRVDAGWRELTEEETVRLKDLEFFLRAIDEGRVAVR